MSVTIRLKRTGRKNAPSYRIVVANTRDKRDGKYLDLIGYFNPSTNPQEIKIDKEKYTDWKKKGALVTDAVEKLVEGKYEYVPYEPVHVKKEAGTGGYKGPEAEQNTGSVSENKDESDDKKDSKDSSDTEESSDNDSKSESKPEKNDKKDGE